MSGVTLYIGNASTLANIREGVMITPFNNGKAIWIDLPTGGPSGIGTDGPGNNTILGYCAAGANYLLDTNTMDIAIRSRDTAAIRFGNSTLGTTNSAMSIKGNNMYIQNTLYATGTSDTVFSNTKITTLTGTTIYYTSLNQGAAAGSITSTNTTSTNISSSTLTGTTLYTSVINGIGETIGVNSALTIKGNATLDNFNFILPTTLTAATTSNAIDILQIVPAENQSGEMIVELDIVVGGLAGNTGVSQSLRYEVPLGLTGSAGLWTNCDPLVNRNSLLPVGNITGPADNFAVQVKEAATGYIFRIVKTASASNYNLLCAVNYNITNTKVSPTISKLGAISNTPYGTGALISTFGYLSDGYNYDTVITGTWNIQFITGTTSPPGSKEIYTDSGMTTLITSTLRVRRRNNVIDLTMSGFTGYSTVAAGVAFPNISIFFTQPLPYWATSIQKATTSPDYISGCASSIIYYGGIQSGAIAPSTYRIYSSASTSPLTGTTLSKGNLQLLYSGPGARTTNPSVISFASGFPFQTVGSNNLYCGVPDNNKITYCVDNLSL
jgi:hypothetical protein